MRARARAAALAAALAGAVGAGPAEDARAMLGRNEVGEAAALAGKALEQSPGDLALLDVLADALARAGRTQEAFRTHRRALALRPGDPDLVRALRTLRKSLVRELRGVLRQRPDDPTARHSLAFLLALEGKRAKAHEQLRELTRQAPSFAPAWQDLGWLEVSGGDLPAGARAVGRAVQLDPLDPGIKRHFRALKEIEASGGAPQGRDPFYGVLEVEAAEPAGPPTDAPAPEGPIDFEDVDLDDDSLVSSLLRRIERESGVAATPTDAGDDGSPPGDEPAEEGPGSSVVPTPLEVVRKLQEAYDRGVAALEAHRYEEAEKALALVVSVKSGYRDAEELLRRAEEGAVELDRFDRAMVQLDAGDGKAAARTLSTLDRRLVEAAREDVNFDALRGDAAYLAGDWSAAERYYRAALPRIPKDAERRYRLVMALAEQEDAPGALEQLAILEEVEPGYASSQQGFGRVRLELYVRRYFLLIVGLASLWVLAAVGYVVFAGRRKVTGDALAETMDELSEALRAEDSKRVLEVASRLEAMELGDEDAARLRAARITALLAEEELEEAAGQLKKLAKDSPEDPTLPVLRGRLALAHRRAEPETLPDLEALMRAEAGNVEVLRLLDRYFRDRGDYGELAQEVTRRLNDLEPDTPEHILRLARFRLHAGDTSEEAALQYQRALSASPKDLDARKGMALHLSAAGKHLDALGYAKEVLHQDPGDTGCRQVAMDAYRALALHKEGIRELERLHEETGDAFFREAADELEALRSRAADADAQERAEEKELGGAYSSGVKLFSEGRHAEAVPMLQAAMEAESYRMHAGALLVKSYLSLGEAEQARETFARIDSGEIPSDEFMIGLCYAMAGALQGRGEYEQACDLYRRVCKADVDYKDAFDRFEELQEQIDLSA